MRQYQIHPGFWPVHELDRTSDLIPGLSQWLQWHLSSNGPSKVHYGPLFPNDISLDRKSLVVQRREVSSLRYCHAYIILVRSRWWRCLVTRFYQIIAKPGNRTGVPSWPDPYPIFNANTVFLELTLCFGIKFNGKYRFCDYIHDFDIWHDMTTISSTMFNDLYQMNKFIIR